MASIAILGTGQMGAAMARRLQQAGHRLTVWNRTPAKAQALADVTVAATPAEAVADADLIVSMLRDGPAVEAVFFGSSAGGSAVSAMREGALVAQMSTIAPREVRDLAARMPATVSFLDSPVGGSIGAAVSGELTLFVGGPDAVIDRAEPVLRDLGTVRRCGPIGAGSALKLVVNSALLTALAALHDALAVADAVGVDRTAAVETLLGGPLSGAIARATATGASFAISLAAKDVRLALAETANAPVLAAALALLEESSNQDADIATISA